MEIERNGLSEAVRLMQTASSLAGNYRREVERKSADTFWRSIGIGRGEDATGFAPSPLHASGKGGC